MCFAIERGDDAAAASDLDNVRFIIHDSAMIEIGGTYQSGTGTASKNLLTQLNLIAQEFPEIEGCHSGTMNVALEENLFVIAPDHRTKPIHWNDTDFPHGETFDLLRVKMEFPGSKASFDAWLYVAHGSPHRATPKVHELISARQDGLNLGMKCKILINRHFYRVPPGQPIFLRHGIYVV